MTPSKLRRFLALAVTAGLLAGGVPATLVAAPATGELSGRVVGEDGVTPRPGVVVHLYDSGSGSDFASSPTRRDGVFTIAAAPAGTYELLVEAEGGAFLAGSPLELAPGQNSPVALQLRAGAETLDQTPAGSSGVPPGRALSPLVKWIIVGTIVVAAAFVINEVTEDEDEEPLASGF